MDATQPKRQPRRRLRILCGVALVLAFLGSVGFILLKSPLPLALVVVLIVVAAVSIAVFAAYFVPNKLSPRFKRAFTVGTAAVGLITTLIAVPAIQNGTKSAGDSPQGDPLTATLNLNNSAGCEDFIVEASLLSSVPDGDDLNAQWVYEHGGATFSIVAPMVLTVQGKGEEAVVLTGLRIKELERLPEPTHLADLLPCGATGGALEERFFKVDFGDPPKVTAEPGYDASTGKVVQAPAKFPFKVSVSDPEVFYLELEERPCFCTWRLALDWVSGGRSGTTVIDRGFGKIRTDSNRDEEGKRPIYSRLENGTWDPPLPK